MESVVNFSLRIVKTIFAAGDDVCTVINGSLQQFSAIQVILATVVIVVFLRKMASTIYEWRRLGIKAVCFRFAVKLPFVRTRVEMEKQKYGAENWARYLKQRTDPVKEVPKEAMAMEAIESRMKKGDEFCRKAWVDGGRLSGAVYHPEDQHWDQISAIMRMFITVNPLHCDEFIPVTQMEAEIIRMSLNLYRGDANTAGIGTSGGTESILLAMLAYREQGKAEKGIEYPNIVASETAHAAFDKAGFYFGMEVRKVPVTADLKADVAAMKRAIDSNTVVIVSSGPEYPYGNYDPLPEIAALAQRYNIGCHLDCCLGGFVNPFAEEAGYKLPYVYDFRQPGVTSISADTHKYAFGPKGYSVCLFRN
jgi:sphinganine-1-phosphate aldolase